MTVSLTAKDLLERWNRGEVTGPSPHKHGDQVHSAFDRALRQCGGALDHLTDVRDQRGAEAAGAPRRLLRHRLQDLQDILRVAVGETVI